MRQIQYKLPNVILTEIPERQLRKDTDVKVRIAYAAFADRISMMFLEILTTPSCGRNFWRDTILATKPPDMWSN